MDERGRELPNAVSERFCDGAPTASGSLLRTSQ